MVNVLIPPVITLLNTFIPVIPKITNDAIPDSGSYALVSTIFNIIIEIIKLAITKISCLEKKKYGDDLPYVKVAEIDDASNIKNAPAIANNNVNARIGLFKCLNTFTFFFFFIFYQVYYTKMKTRRKPILDLNQNKQKAIVFVSVNFST